MAESMLSKGLSSSPTMEKSGNTADAVLPRPINTKAQQENFPPRKEMQKKPDKAVKTSQQVNKSTSNAGVEAFSKEIGKILKELNNNVSKQGDALQKLSERVDTLYDDPYYYESNDGEIIEDEENCDDLPVESSASCDNSVPHDVEDSRPYKKVKTVFEGLSDKFLLSEKVDNEVDDDLALFVNTSFRNGVSEDRVSEISKEIVRPRNCGSLTKTRVNPGIWRLLKPQTQTDDAKMQTIQGLLIKASTDIVKLVDKNSDVFDTQSVEWGTNALALLGQCNKIMNNKRKDAHKQDLDPKFHPLTSSTLPFTEYLYGNETDINRNVKDIQEMSRIGKVGRPSRGRGNRGGPYQRGARGARRGRGRGYAKSDHGVGYNNWSKNQKEGQKK